MATPSVPKTSVGQVCPLWGQGQKSVLKPMGSFSMYVCVKVMSGHCFGEERKDSTAFTAGVASLGKVSFRIPWGLSLCTFV